MKYKELDLSFYQNAVVAYQSGNKKIFVSHEDCAEDPLDWGHFDFLSLSKNYYTDKKHKTILTKNGVSVPLEAFSSLPELEKFFIQNNYLYQFVRCCEHSSLSISIAEYDKNDRLLGGYNFGFLYVSKEDTKKDYGVKKLTDKIIKEVYSHMENFVKNEWEDYINGEVYQCYLIKNGECIDSIGGFYGLSSIDEHTLEDIFNENM